MLLDWWRWAGSNRWPPACKAGALPTELHPPDWRFDVGGKRLENLCLQLTPSSLPSVFGFSRILNFSNFQLLTSNFQLTTGCFKVFSWLLVLSNFQLLTSNFQYVVGLGGFEPPTSRLSGVRSNQLSYRPRTGCLMLEVRGWKTPTP